MSELFIDAGAICAATFVRRVEVHETLGSTNDRAIELARLLAIDVLPALVVARQQTAGRGRGAHTWWAADGALTFSLLLAPEAFGIGTASWPQLSLATAVAVCDVLLMEAPDAQIGIKWPNDVFIAGRKVCGILIESPAGVAVGGKRLVVGVGINVNNLRQDAPAEVRGRGTALCDVTGAEHKLQGVLTGFLKALEYRIGQLNTRDGELVVSWQRLNVLSGRPVTIENAGTKTCGICHEIDENGALVLKTNSEHARFISGSVRVAL